MRCLSMLKSIKLSSDAGSKYIHLVQQTFGNFRLFKLCQLILYGENFSEARHKFNMTQTA